MEKKFELKEMWFNNTDSEVVFTQRISAVRYEGSYANCAIECFGKFASKKQRAL